tara:strand:- start:44 stop:685 length:642 start_codon:yes stop_codon:yes gene_type:complete
MIKLTKRKGFNFFRSYYDVYNELSDKDKVAFMDALFDRQFLGVKPEGLEGMAKFAYISQTNSIDSQVKGYEDKTGLKLNNFTPTVGVKENILTPTLQVQVEGKGEVQVQVEDKDIKEERFVFRKELINYGFEEGLVEDWLKVRKTKKATNTQTAFTGFISQVEKAGKDKNFILRTCIEKSWSGFKVEWLEEKKKEGRKTGSQELRDALNNYTS